MINALMLALEKHVFRVRLASALYKNVDISNINPKVPLSFEF
jgi:hypothetical protein